MITMCSTETEWRVSDGSSTFFSPTISPTVQLYDLSNDFVLSNTFFAKRYLLVELLHVDWFINIAFVSSLLQDTKDNQKLGCFSRSWARVYPCMPDVRCFSAYSVDKGTLFLWHPQKYRILVFFFFLLFRWLGFVIHILVRI